MRGLPASVISATLHLPAAIAAAAWPTWNRYDEPPVSVESRYADVQAEVLGHRDPAEAGRVAVAEVGVDVASVSPASASAPSATSAWIWGSVGSGMSPPRVLVRAGDVRLAADRHAVRVS